MIQQATVYAYQGTPKQSVYQETPKQSVLKPETAQGTEAVRESLNHCLIVWIGLDVAAI